MGKKTKALIIVESPAKIKALQKILGPEYLFASSVGHIRDLPEKEFGIDIERDFEPTYVVLPQKETVIKQLKQAARECETVYLSPDPDREGEAIAWHIAQILPAGTNYQRISFNSITKEVVLLALKNPRSIDLALVNAQQARRLLDRIVGYSISPILNRRLQRGRTGAVSAGRVQSVALKLVVDREKEIEAFVPVEYWNLGAIFSKLDDPQTFRSSLYSVDGKRVEKENAQEKDAVLIPNKKTADQLLARMKKEPYLITRVENKEKKRNPVAPFITSTLQQEASRHYGFSSSKTMSLAQKLYEGIDLGNEGTEGLITYMRTDSVRVVPEALEQVRYYIDQRYGQEYLPKAAQLYTSKKSAQDAHEAIRPTYLTHPPETIKSYLSRDEGMLYELIWKRFVASQMNPAVYDTLSVDIAADDGLVLRTTGSLLKFDGFLAVYEEKVDEKNEEESRALPVLKEGEYLNLIELTADQAFTRPPPRFTEALLVKELEKSGIGRPSTYAAIMNKIQSREYTFKEKGRLRPTELGCVIAQMLETNFEEIMNVGFTAKMEDSLELVAENEKDWKGLIREFWDQFSPTLEKAKESAFVPKILTDIKCPECESLLQKIWYKTKYFYGCSRYPDCKYTTQTEALAFDKADYAAEFDWEQKCPQCSSEMDIRHGRFGPFLGCKNYPECRGIINIPKKGEEVISQEEMPACPAIGCKGQLTARKSRYGKTFYSCSTFHESDVIVNDLDQLVEKYPNHPRTAYEKKAKRGRAASKDKKTAAKEGRTSKTPKKAAGAKRTMAPIPLSPTLAAIVGAKEMTRGEVTKKLWVYIKENKLQDSDNKRLIRPDSKLAKLFGSGEPIDMMQLAKLITPHFNREKL